MTQYKDCPKFNKYDEYMTRKSAWEDIIDYIPRGKVIWEAFMGNGQSGNFLKELGFEVYMKNEDFFETPNSGYGDIVVSNPPYTNKKEVFERLKYIGKPFILLVPTTVLHTKYFKETFENERIQLIIPFRKRQFDKLGVNKQKDNCSFYTLYICWRIGLPKDVILI